MSSARARSRPGMTRATAGWLGLAWLAFAVLPWYVLPGDGWLDLALARGAIPDAATAPALLQGLLHGRPWLLPAALPLLLPFLAWRRPKEDPRVATVARGGGRRRPRVDRSPGLGHRPPGLVGGVAREPPRRAGAPPGRLRHGRLPPGPGVPHAPLPRPRGAGLHEGRCVPRERDRPRRRRSWASSSSGRSLTVLVERGARRGRRVRARGLLRQALDPLRSGAWTASAARSGAAWPGTRCSSRSWWAPARRSSAWPSP